MRSQVDFPNNGHSSPNLNAYTICPVIFIAPSSNLHDVDSRLDLSRTLLRLCGDILLPAAEQQSHQQKKAGQTYRDNPDPRTLLLLVRGCGAGNAVESVASLTGRAESAVVAGCAGDGVADIRNAEIIEGREEISGGAGEAGCIICTVLAVGRAGRAVAVGEEVRRLAD